MFIHLHGVFKKRPNFADGAQMAIVSDMWLLWFLSSKFWQQTAVSLIPLHVVFVELHPQNEHVTRSVDPTMQQLEKQHACVRNSASNFGIRLWKHLNCWSEFTGRNAWVVRNAMSGLRVSKKVELSQWRPLAWMSFHINRRPPCQESSWGD